LTKATESHEKTVLDLAAAESTSRAARAAVLEIEKQLEIERIALNRAMGFPPEARPQIEGGVLPADVDPPGYESLIANLETTRLDLLGLKAGYVSQDEALRAAIIAQVPRINLGFTRATDTSNVQTLGFGISVDIPIFDRNQGNIGTERATRQKLFDEYTDRVFQARADIATGLANIRWLNRQIAENQKSIAALEQLVKTAGTALEQGNGDAISYYQTRYDLILKRIELQQFKVQLAESIVGLEISAGRYLPLQP
jgi:outer membrane protein TolC